MVAENPKMAGKLIIILREWLERWGGWVYEKIVIYLGLMLPCPATQNIA
jgi:hypothetical protein